MAIVTQQIGFVIAPIGEPTSPVRARSDKILKHVIEPCLQECGYNAIRADKISEPGEITNQILTHILNDPLVIADLTGQNPNVFYELAVRHMTQKPVILLIQKGEKIPFDVSTIRVIQIDHQDLDSVADAKIELIKQIRAVESKLHTVSPVSLAASMQVLKESADPTQKALAEIREMIQNFSVTYTEIKNSLQKMNTLAEVKSSLPLETSAEELISNAKKDLKLAQDLKKYFATNIKKDLEKEPLEKVSP